MRTALVVLGLVLAPVVAIPGTRSLAAEPLALELGDGMGEPGETVEVPVHVTYERPLVAVAAVFTFDASRLEYLAYTLEDTDAAHMDPLTVLYRTFRPGEGIFGISPDRHPSRDFRVAPGTRRIIGKLLFRVRPLAEAGPADIVLERSIPSTGLVTAVTLDMGFENQAFEPDVLEGARITVEPPSGPRPVGDLVCKQVLDRVELTFSLSEPYDAIEVLRDGTLVALLSGDRTGFSEYLLSIGAFDYSVIARRGAATSVATTCRLEARAPAAPPVLDLACSEGTLTWTSPVTFDRVTVFRDSEPIAVLPGDSTSYLDPAPPDGLAVYTVVGELEGYRGPEIHCLRNGVWMLEAGDVEVPLDAEVLYVPIYATTSAVSVNFDCHLEIDLSRFEYIADVELGIEGTVTHPEPEMIQTGIGMHLLPALGVIYDVLPPTNPEKNLASGLRQLVYRFPFRPVGAFKDGDVFPVSIRQGSIGINGPGGVDSVRPITLLGGEIRFGTGAVAPVEDLVARAAPGGGGAGSRDTELGGGGSVTEVRATWRNPSRYDRIQVVRNGEVLADIPGDLEEFVDADVTSGVYTYKVVGVRGEARSFPRTALVSTLKAPGTFKRGDSNRDGRVNIGDPIATLLYLFLGGAAPTCEDAADADDDGRLTLADPIVTLRVLFSPWRPLPAPGSGYAWFDPTTDELSCRH
jgi:hypothetical protein